MSIRNLEELLSTNLAKYEKVVHCETSTLITVPGENYSSALLSLKVTVKNETTGEERVLGLVGKVLPTNEYLQKVSNSKVTFKNEAGFYSTALPALEKFSRSRDVNQRFEIGPKFFGARTTLNTINNNDIDNDAVLLMENLKEAGYTTIKRLLGFDYDSTKAVLQTLAKFHAVPLALRIKEPKTFDEKIRPYLTDFYHDDLFVDILKTQLTISLTNDEECSKYLELAKRRIFKNTNKVIDKKWATVMHNDLWVTNIMLKYEGDKVVDVKFVDFQICEYKSGLRDLLSFLFSSVCGGVLEQHLDEFLDYYYKEFIRILKYFEVDIAGYSKADYEQQLKYDARESEFYHILNVLNPTFYEGKPMNLLELTPESVEKDLLDMGFRHMERIRIVTREFAKRGWL